MVCLCIPSTLMETVGGESELPGFRACCLRVIRRVRRGGCALTCRSPLRGLVPNRPQARGLGLSSSRGCTPPFGAVSSHRAPDSGPRPLDRILGCGGWAQKHAVVRGTATKPSALAWLGALWAWFEFLDRIQARSRRGHIHIKSQRQPTASIPASGY